MNLGTIRGEKKRSVKEDRWLEQAHQLELIRFQQRSVQEATNVS